MAAVLPKFACDARNLLEHLKKGVRAMRDLTPGQLTLVRALLARHVPRREVRAFGSRGGRGGHGGAGTWIWS